MDKPRRGDTEFARSPMIRAKITDARGRSHRLRWFLVHTSLQRELSAETLRRVLNRLPAELAESIPRTRRRGDDTTAIGLSALGAVLGVEQLSRGSWWGAYMLVASIGLFASTFIRPWSIPTVWRRRPSAINLLHDALLAERVCPACLYTLASDRLTDRFYLVCPECGAAWFPPLPPDGPTPAPEGRH